MNPNPRYLSKKVVRDGYATEKDKTSDISLARIKKLGVVISTSPQWISWFSDGDRDITDDATMANYMWIGTMLKKKIPLAFGCDVPASITHLPGWAFYGATTRESLETGYIPDPQECIDIYQALRIHKDN